MTGDEAAPLHPGDEVRDRRAVQVDLVAQFALAQLALAVQDHQDGVLHARDVRGHDARPGRDVQLLRTAEQVARVAVRLLLCAVFRDDIGHDATDVAWSMRNPAKKAVSSARAVSGSTLATY